MGFIKFSNNASFEVKIKKINDTLIKVFDPIPVISGFIYYLDEKLTQEVCNCNEFKTVYKAELDGIIYSNDGSVYSEPVIEEPVVIEPTAEELAAIARQQEIANINMQLAAIDLEFEQLDYIGTKIATGRATIDEYSEQIARMTELAAEKDLLQAQLLQL